MLFWPRRKWQIYIYIYIEKWWGIVIHCSHESETQAKILSSSQDKQKLNFGDLTHRPALSGSVIF